MKCGRYLRDSLCHHERKFVSLQHLQIAFATCSFHNEHRLECSSGQFGIMSWLLCSYWKKENKGIILPCSAFILGLIHSAWLGWRSRCLLLVWDTLAFLSIILCKLHNSYKDKFQIVYQILSQGRISYFPSLLKLSSKNRNQ